MTKRAPVEKKLGCIIGISIEIRLPSQTKLDFFNNLTNGGRLKRGHDYLKFNPCLHSHHVVFPLVLRDILRTSALLRYHNCLKCLLAESKHFSKDSTISCLLKLRGASFIPIC